MKASFGFSVLAMPGAIVLTPVDLVAQGFLTMGTLYLIATTFTLPGPALPAPGAMPQDMPRSETRRRR